MGLPGDPGIMSIQRSLGLVLNFQILAQSNRAPAADPLAKIRAMKEPAVQNTIDAATEEPTEVRSGENFSLDRTGDRPVIFSGARIGFGTSKTHESTEWTDVTIYKTVGGCYVTDIDNFSVVPGSELCLAFTFDSPEMLVASLRDPAGKLDRAALAACQDAARNDPDFTKWWGEKVE